jgi:uncharacterized damage-inducible protein DinB
MENQLIETWQIHHRIHLYMLSAIDQNSLQDVASSKGRTVGEQFAHIHNVRLMWLKEAAPELLELEGLEKIEKNEITKEILLQQLELSSGAIVKLLQKGLDDGRIKGFKPHPTAFLGYLISHESHHRGQISLCLKQSGHPLDRKTLFGMWEWGTR